MFFFDCEKGFVPDDGQNDVTDGTVENYPLDWPEPNPVLEDPRLPPAAAPEPRPPVSETT